MASSQYTFFMAVQPKFNSGYLNSGYLNSGYLNSVLGKPDQLVRWEYGLTPLEFNKQEYLVGLQTHSCRETLLSYASRALDEKNIVAPNLYKYISFLYLKEGGSALTEDRIKKIMKFKDILGLYLPLHIIDNYAGNKVISISIPYSSDPQKYFYLASLFMWIFRKDVIMDWLIDYMNKQTYKPSMQDLLKILAERFLLETDWGDINNNPIFMSIFCYSFTSIVGYPAEANGPVNLAKKFDANLLNKYFENLYAPLLTQLGDGFPGQARVDSYSDTKFLAPFVKFYYKKPRKPTIKKVVVETTQESEV